MATIEDFNKMDIRVGKIIEVEDFPEARKPSYKLKINLGNEIGIKKSCAQLVNNYSKQDLNNKLVLCVVNFPPRQIGSSTSEVLTLGVPDSKEHCVLIEPERNVDIGAKLYWGKKWTFSKLLNWNGGRATEMEWFFFAMESFMAVFVYSYCRLLDLCLVDAVI